MRKIYNMFAVTLVTLALLGCSSESTAKQTTQESTKSTKEAPKAIQSVQVYTVDNSDGKITAKTIEAAFDANALTVDGNNNMNSPFEKRFNNVHYKVYHLAMFRNNDLTFKLIKKYSNFGALTPLTMSIWSDGNTMNVSTLTLEGMARASEIPVDDADLVAYSKLIDKALKAALPNGAYKNLDFKIKFPKKSLASNFEMEVELDEDTTAESFKEDFQAEFEGELEPLGFLFPNFINLNEEMFDEAGYKEYDFFDTYSICKFDVIYPVSKMHPEAGAYAPCSFYMYKKKSEDKMHMGFLSVDNWITTLDVEDEASIKPLRDAQAMIESIINEMTE